MSHKERLISGIGGGLAIFIVFAVTLIGEQEMHARVILIASMGASAVLLFAVPHGAMSQPWNVIGGHMVSALIGVVLHMLISDPALAAGLAAGLAIIAMLYLGCLHPPGGASALIPILSGTAADEYGLTLVLFPIGFGAILIVAFAVIYNLPFAWRRYPLTLWQRQSNTKAN